ncbi:MAG TPA: cysteine desulfurase [Spirochaetia bacterium]|nr:cysteine desulfurase [Spirochaetia bacterium]
MAVAKIAQLGGRTVEDVREDFPILDRTVHGKPLAYLDNAATSQKPRAVLDAIRVYYEHGNANVHRALHTLGEEATAAFEQNRGKVQRFLNARSKREIIFTRGTTEAINLVAASWGDTFLKKGDVVLLTDMEHHSNLVPWQLLCARTGCTLAFIPLTADGELDLAAAEREWTDRIRMVAVTHVSNVLGTVNDVKAITELAHSRGALVLVDAAQSVPHFRVDVTDIDCDFLAFSGHKMCGPMGIGVLYGKERVLEEMPPWMGGGEMISSVRRETSTWNELPHKFEAGTPNVEGAIGLGAAVDYLHGLQLPAIEAWEAELASYALRRLREVPQLTIYGPVGHRGAVISFNLGSIHAHDVAQYLDKEGIAVRAGHHCAQPLMRLLDIPGTARASFSFYNMFSEIDRLRDALLAAAEFYA